MSSPRVRRKKEDQYHHGDLRRALLAAGEQLLAHGGVEALSLREVAQRAGVSHAAPYRHFASKDELLAALAEQGFRDLAAELSAARGKDPVSAFEAMGLGYVRFAQAHPAQIRIMFRAGLVSEVRPSLKQAAHEAFGLLVSGVVSCQQAGELAAGDPLPLALSCWAMVHGLAVLSLDGAQGFAALSDRAGEALARRSLRQLFEGMRR